MIKCIAIDDEPLALKQMESYIIKTPELELICSFDNGLQAMIFLNEESVDLMFVDINMPDLSGMDFVKSLKSPPKVIFTTAYSEYALEGFKVDAVDYLLKPISYADFLKSVNKAKERILSEKKSKNSVSSNKDYLFIKSEYKIIRLNFSEIKFIEGMREYVSIHTENHKEPIMTLMSMKKLEEHLKNTSFMRVHRSYIVNLSKITTIERNEIIFEKKIIPVSNQYKEKFQEYINKNFLT